MKLCLAVLAAYLALAIFGEVQYRVAEYRDVTPAYNTVDMSARYSPPCREHWLGTDNLAAPSLCVSSRARASLSMWG